MSCSSITIFRASGDHTAFVLRCIQMLNGLNPSPQLESLEALGCSSHVQTLSMSSRLFIVVCPPCLVSSPRCFLSLLQHQAMGICLHQDRHVFRTECPGSNIETGRHTTWQDRIMTATREIRALKGPLLLRRACFLVRILLERPHSKWTSSCRMQEAGKFLFCFSLHARWLVEYAIVSAPHSQCCSVLLTVPKQC